MTIGASNQMIGQAGLYFVAGEMCRRGARNVVFKKDGRRTTLIIGTGDGDRLLDVQVKTKTAGDWQSSVKEGGEPSRANGFWILVDLMKTVETIPNYYIVPDAAMRKIIREDYEAYLARHGGERARNPSSKHFAIKLKFIAQYKDRWEQLDLL